MLKMKFRDCIEESDLSSSYNKIIKKVNADVKMFLLY